MQLADIVKHLILQNKEGEYWDFKVEHHKSNADLLHDIICLANTIRHKGNRYLVYGVNNKHEIVGLSGACGSQNRKNQAQIIDLLKKSNFAGGEFPMISLEAASIDDKDIDVIIIQDLPRKPYYLEKIYEENTGNSTKRIYAGSIYTRVQDTNTAKDSTASIADVEAMWRQRWGLDLTPLERMRIYLSEHENWESIFQDNSNTYYYTKFPEFKVRKGAHFENENFGEAWLDNFRNVMCSHVDVCYYETILQRILFFECENRFLIPLPEEEVSINGVLEYKYYSSSLRYMTFMLIQHFQECDFDGFLAISKIKLRINSIFM